MVYAATTTTMAMAHLNTTIMRMVMAVDPVTVMQSLVNPRSTSSGGQMVMAIDPFAVVWAGV